MARRASNRTRILDVAERAVLAKGFEGTSIDEIVAGAEITRSGFFYHFPDKNALALALVERYIEEDHRILDRLFFRAGELDEDPLHALLIGLKMFAELMDDMPEGHPGCMIATAVQSDRIYVGAVREASRRAMLGWRIRFRALLDAIAALYRPRDPVNLDDLADMMTGAVEGGIIMAKILGEPRVTGAQVMLVRSYVRLLFAPGAH